MGELVSQREDLTGFGRAVVDVDDRKLRVVEAKAGDVLGAEGVFEDGDATLFHGGGQPFKASSWLEKRRWSATDWPRLCRTLAAAATGFDSGVRRISRKMGEATGLRGPASSASAACLARPSRIRKRTSGLSWWTSNSGKVRKECSGVGSSGASGKKKIAKGRL
jgi:hypothetical protein